MERAKEVADAVKEEEKQDKMSSMLDESLKDLQVYMSRFPATPGEKAIWQAQRDVLDYQVYVTQMAGALTKIFNIYSITRQGGGPPESLDRTLLMSAGHIIGGAAEQAKVFLERMEPILVIKRTVEPCPEDTESAAARAKVLKVIADYDRKAREDVAQPAVGAASAPATITVERTPVVKQSSGDDLLAAAAATGAYASSLGGSDGDCESNDEAVEEKRRARFMFG